MRLIDADALIEGRVSNDNVVICAKCAPTIDAIPVEWLERKAREGLDGVSFNAITDTIECLIGAWQNEQEAR